MPAPWGQQYVRAGMLIELARRELKAFPDQAADDAHTAFGMFLSLPGGGPNVDLRPPVTPEKLARMGKMQAEPEAIRILLAAGRGIARSSSRARPTSIAPICTIRSFGTDRSSARWSWPMNAAPQTARIRSRPSQMSRARLRQGSHD